ncbi:uncharacterized protein LOC126907598 isoform X2 [Daktulosphaira vitifoliae]|uniref:uncharacterized protein LOC126907598 isoform X2 n=1 Tax=Daktulosphaira vitifoliae TaxID=58002 RepID=UPI0021AA59D2|nr:uncharacterized protein LOC126907598 isoform X2 [Daktulosphaira vitifoliae]
MFFRYDWLFKDRTTILKSNMQHNIIEKILNDKILWILSLYCKFNPFNLAAIQNFKFHQFCYTLLLLWEFIVMNLYAFIGFYYVLNDIFSVLQLFIFITMDLKMFLTTYRLSTKYEELRKLFDATRIDFLSSSYKEKNIFEHNKSMCTKIINIYIFLCFLLIPLWILIPLFVKEYPFKKRDGSLIIYRNNILNSFFSFIPISIYEQIYPIVFTFEAINVLHIIFNVLFCNLIIIEFCWMLSTQLKIIALKCETFGYNNLDLGQKNDCISMINLKKLLLDHTRLNISIKNFYDIMKPLTIYSFGYYFDVFILYTFLSILAFKKNDYVLSFTSMKYLLTTLMSSFNLFIICYFYNHLENEAMRMSYSIISLLAKKTNSK